MEKIAAFFADFIAQQTRIKSLVLGDDEDLLVDLASNMDLPALMVKIQRRTFRGHPDEELMAVYEVYFAVLFATEKGNYAGRKVVWQKAEREADQLTAHVIEHFRGDWASVQSEFFSGFTSANLAGIWTVLTIEIPKTFCPVT